MIKLEDNDIQIESSDTQVDSSDIKVESPDTKVEELDYSDNAEKDDGSIKKEEDSPSSNVDGTDAEISGDEETPNPKVDAILRAISEQDVHELEKLASSPGGFLTDELRRDAWPLLLGLPSSNKENTPPDWTDLPPHPEEEQVRLDVNRSFVYYPEGLDEQQRATHQKHLLNIITQILRRNPFLYYFQGYHDICQVCLLVLRPTLAPAVITHVSLTRIRDFMLPSIRPALDQLHLIPDIVTQACPELRRILSVINPAYALSSTLTMYAHTIHQYRDIARLFDILLARPPDFTLYMFAQILISQKHELLSLPLDEDPAILQVILSKIPGKLDFDALIPAADELYESHPPERLPSWKRISPYSVLKTPELNTYDNAQILFQSHIQDLKRRERQAKAMALLRQHKGQAAVVSIAIVIALFGMYSRSHHGHIVGDRYWHQIMTTFRKWWGF